MPTLPIFFPFYLCLTGYLLFIDRGKFIVRFCFLSSGIQQKRRSLSHDRVFIWH